MASALYDEELFDVSDYKDNAVEAYAVLTKVVVDIKKTHWYAYSFTILDFSDDLDSLSQIY